MQNFPKLLSLWKWSSIDDNLYDWAIMVFNFLLYIYLFIRCIKLEENFENLPCEKLCQVKVTKFLSADENLYRSFFLFCFFFADEYFLPTNIFRRLIGMKVLIQNLKVNYYEMTSAVDRKSDGTLQQNQIMNLQWKESKLFKKITNKKVVYRMLRKWTLLHKPNFLIVLKIL